MQQDGVLLIDKPQGMTSHDVVGYCRKIFKRRDIGHAGTLDPMATGLLVILIGKATKLSDYILNGDKSYATTVLLGQETDTDDITGQVTNEAFTEAIDFEQVEQAIKKLTGVINLKIPIYSAKKVKGEKLYQKARRGDSFTAPSKDMEFRNIKLMSFKKDRVSVQFECSKGSFVRAWGKALGESLGCGGTIETLRRITSNPYDVKNGINLETLKTTPLEKIYENKAWVPLSQTLPKWPALKIEGYDEKLLINGQISRKLERYLEVEYAQMDLEGIKLLSKRSNRLISLLSYQPPRGFKIKRVFPQN